MRLFRKLTRRYRIYESLEVRAKARGHDQDPTWRLFRLGHSGDCGNDRDLSLYQVVAAQNSVSVFLSFPTSMRHHVTDDGWVFSSFPESGFDQKQYQCFERKITQLFMPYYTLNEIARAKENLHFPAKRQPEYWLQRGIRLLRLVQRFSSFLVPFPLRIP